MRADEETGRTSNPRIWAGGDIVTGAATVILAMGAGKKAVRRSLRCELDELFEPAWSDAVLKDGISFEDISSRFDYMLETIDARLFGLDLPGSNDPPASAS